jgi:hypothetical protein
MINPSFDENEAPVDPAMLRVQARMRRLMLIAGLTLGFGIFAVFGAILYKIVGSGDKTSVVIGGGGSRTIEASLPADAHLVSTSTAGDRLVLAYEHPGGTLLIFIDPKSLAVVGRLELKPK